MHPENSRSGRIWGGRVTGGMVATAGSGAIAGPVPNLGKGKMVEPRGDDIPAQKPPFSGLWRNATLPVCNRVCVTVTTYFQQAERLMLGRTYFAADDLRSP